MPTSRKQEDLKRNTAELRERRSSSAEKPKAAGTRVGDMVDWREGGGKGGAEKSRLGNSFRDGR